MGGGGRGRTPNKRIPPCGGSTPNLACTHTQIHNWASDLDDPSIPSIEFVSVGKSYVVTDGEKTYLDVHQVPALSPRQLKILASAPPADEVAPGSATAATAAGMIQEIPREYLLKRLGGLGGKT